MEQEVEAQLATVGKLIDALMEFAVAYGFQLLGALVVLVIGLKISGWTGQRVVRFSQSKEIDETLSKFIGGVVKLVIVGFVVIITLGNFGISIAPLIALAGASAFGATLAIQGPLSNYGAGLSIIMTRPFVVGDTITVHRASGVVDTVTLAYTVLVGEDGERITVPNKEIVGQVIVNSEKRRVVETKIAIAQDEDAGRAIGALRDMFKGFPDIAGTGPNTSGTGPNTSGTGDDAPAPQVGIHDFTYGGIILGLRFWAPSQRYFETRYRVNEAALEALSGAGIRLLPAAATLPAASLSADEPTTPGG